MIGIDATRAWPAVWTPQNEWFGFDPTNDQMVDERYILGLGPRLRGCVAATGHHLHRLGEQRDRRRRRRSAVRGRLRLRVAGEAV
jgi:hypothetical protein